MAALGIVLITGGYTLSYYAYFQLRGATGGFLSYLVPGRVATEKGYMFSAPAGATQPASTASGAAGGVTPGLASYTPPSSSSGSSSGSGSGSGTGVTLV